MKRKDFLSSVLAGGSLLSVLPTLASHPGMEGEDHKKPVIPPYLKPGDTIGITCPAGFIMLKDIEPAMEQMKSWGFNIKVGDTVGKRDFTFGGSDADRAADFQQMLNDPAVKAIMCARGGYGFVRIVDQLNFSALVARPKWIIGFSDITVLHCHLDHNYGIASIHSKMCNSFPDDWSKAEPIQIETILSIKKALTGERMQYSTTPSAFNRVGTAEGVLVGGNLKTIETLAGSASDLTTAGKILFVEDTGEYLYSIDRMFWNLQRTGKLKDLKALVVGGFKVKVDDPGDEFGRTLYDIVMAQVKDYNYPVCFDFPVGHQKNNYALKCGVKHKLTVTVNEVTLKEI
jgi:muramoyltetrapeptide carboxypeptidase